MNAPLQNAPQVAREKFARLAALILILAGVAAYANSFSNAFIFDDLDSIVSNPAVRHLWPIGLNRPLLNLSLAANFALSGLHVATYHAFNLAVHLLAALTLFGLVRRTLTLPAFRARFEGAATGLALATALIWEVHPLQTESVSYIVQRAESLAGLFYLLTLYCVARGADSDRPRRWYAAAFAACVLGMGTKQTVATAPLVALLYDRIFLSGSFRETLRRRWAVYVALAATCLLVLPSFQSPADLRHVSAGFHLPGTTPREYALTQFGVILHYLRLTFWPAGQCLDYTWPLATGLGEVLPGAIVVGALLAATAAALALRPAWGFLGAWFFLILAPTSSFMPIADAAVEHRMYLPLAAVAAGVVIGGYVLLGRLRGNRRGAFPGAAVAVFLAVAVLGYVTALRNLDYRTELSIWKNTLRAAPKNPRAFDGLGKAYFELHDYPRALESHSRAIQLNPYYAAAFNGRAIVYVELREYEKALKDSDMAISLDPSFASFYNTRAVTYAHLGDYQTAMLDYNQAIDLNPEFADAYMNRGVADGKVGRASAAFADFDRAIALKPDYPNAFYNRGNAFFDRDDYDRAIRDYTRAIALRPGYVNAYCNRASAYLWKKDYRRAWADVGAMRSLGVEPPPQLLDQLAKAAPPE